ncbi:LacI family DNA-binding transcriptional regulator [Salipiger mangrovisoli]|uniref:LacI family DNA-binding transcriptional regulator n=1 Tax=Salipiger mangrovisoli TaxID=2865933 RepID=A0ABR9X523_9RHOB|nr:LacI family DNA-binding transcriptional regulator [Salipiger mangrovisoli]MBE9638695.1 LacI family DNA-binding transcriptional regulator [Salipiger mangrovisoli]
MKDPAAAPRIHDVAKLAGVSVATVSRVLSNPSIVSERTRQAVEKAVEETGYTVNLMARNLRQQQVGAVLALVPNLANPFFSEILAGISGTLRAEGLSLLVLDTRQTDPGSPSRGLRAYLNRSRADGVIVLDGSLDPALFDHAACPPVVQACEWIDGLVGPRVLADNTSGARMAVEHLLGLGHRRILHLTGPSANTLSQSRAAGVAAALAAAGLPPAPRIEGAFTLKSGHAASAALLAQAELPSAVFCDNDEMAIGLMAGLRAAGLRIPEDISIVGFDNIEMSAYASVPLTTVRQKRAQLGRRAAETLLAQRSAPAPTELILPVELVVRDSTAPARDHLRVAARDRSA